MPTAPAHPCVIVFLVVLLAGVLAEAGQSPPAPVPPEVISRDAGTMVVEVEIPESGIGEHMAGVLRVAAGGTVELATPPWGLRVG